MLPAGWTSWPPNRIRTASPLSITGGGAGGASAAAIEVSGWRAHPGCQAAIRAKRCGSTPSSTCPAVPPDTLVYWSTAMAARPPGSMRSTIRARLPPGGGVTVSTAAAPTRASATRWMFCSVTDHMATAKPASANAVPSTIVVRIPPGRRATCRRARNRPMPEATAR